MDMAQMMAHLLAEIRASHEEMMAAIRTKLEDGMTKILHARQMTLLTYGAEPFLRSCQL
jgi:hypothetical protein